MFIRLPVRISNGDRPVPALPLPLKDINTSGSAFIHVSPVSSQHLSSLFNVPFPLSTAPLLCG